MKHNFSRLSDITSKITSQKVTPYVNSNKDDSHQRDMVKTLTQFQTNKDSLRKTGDGIG